MRLRADGRVRFVTQDSDSEWMDSWFNTDDGRLKIVFHYLGEMASSRRTVIFEHQIDSEIWIASEPFRVTMQFSRESKIPKPPPTMRVPAGMTTPEINDDDLQDWMIN